MVFPDYKPVTNADFKAKFEAYWGTELDGQKGLTVVEIVNAAHDGTIKGMYVQGENPAMSDPDQTHARQALAKLEHLVVQEIFLTETAFHADVVLPASAQQEKTGTYTNTNRQVQLGRPAISTPGQARQDWWITHEIARRMGHDFGFSEVREIYAEMAGIMPSLANITWDRLEREGSVTYPCPAPDHPGEGIVFSEGFPTPSGRGGMKPVDLTPPAELPDADYPLVLTTGRQLEHWHTGAMTRRSRVLDDLEPEAIVSMHPREIGKRGWRAGQRVRVTTRRGSIALQLRADREVPSGMIFIPFAYAEAAANVLTNPQLDPDGKIPEFKFCAARIEAEDEMEAAE
jgi:formate dehydrogenase major subunit